MNTAFFVQTSTSTSTDSLILYNNKIVYQQQNKSMQSQRFDRYYRY